MTSFKQCFPYERLPSTSDSCTIRLLELIPLSGWGRRDFEFNLKVCSLDGQPQYEALSYCWGTNDKSVTVRCNGALLAITSNLRTTLTNFLTLPAQKPRVLWVDAICINQSDNVEKNHQVAMMARIYGQSQRVLIHLGGSPIFGSLWLHEKYNKKGVAMVERLNRIHNDQVLANDKRTAHKMSASARWRYGIPPFDGEDSKAFLKLFDV